MPFIPPICSKSMHVLYIGPFAQPTEDGELAHEIMLAIHREGISLEIAPTADCDSDVLDEKYRELLSLVRGYSIGQRRVVHEDIWIGERIIREEQTALVRGGFDSQKKQVTHTIVHASPGIAERIIHEEQARDAKEEAWGYFGSSVLVLPSEVSWGHDPFYSFQMIIVRQDTSSDDLRLDALSQFHCIMLRWMQSEKTWTATGSLYQLQDDLNKITRLRDPSDVIRILKEAHGNPALL